MSILFALQLTKESQNIIEYWEGLGLTVHLNKTSIPYTCKTYRGGMIQSAGESTESIDKAIENCIESEIKQRDF